jgi:glucose/mannose-6-phosphate isomerase
MRDRVGEHPRVSARVDALVALAEQRGTHLTLLSAGDGSPVARLAPLVALGDFATTYLALGTGIDPTPIAAIDELKARTAEGERVR